MKRRLLIFGLCFTLLIGSGVWGDSQSAAGTFIQDTSSPETPKESSPQQSDEKGATLPQDEEPSAEKKPGQPKSTKDPAEKQPEESPPDDKNSRQSQDNDNKKSENRTETETGLPFQLRGLSRDSYKQYSKRSKDMVGLFKPLVTSAEVSTVKVLNGNRLVSLGTVVDRNGLILTKASELRGDLNCGFADGRKTPAVVIGVHQDTDLALLKVELDDLQPIHWGHDAIPMVGQWIVTPLFDSNELHVGVVGVNARKIPPSTPFIGIGPALNGAEQIIGAKIDSVQPNTPGDEADLMVGDIITKIDDVEIKDWTALRKTLEQYDPKDEITLTLQRGDQELKIKVILGNREQLESGGGRNPRQDRSAMQNSMGSQPSQRRKDFPLAFQHDLMLNKTTCGGPVINLNGQVVGINIARAGRVDSLALPVSTVLSVLEVLKSGELAPAKVNQARLVALEKELEEVNLKLGGLTPSATLENQFQVEKARKEELDRARVEMQKALDELENRIKVVDLKKGNIEKEIRSIKNERNSLDRRKHSLEREHKGLTTGVN